MINHKLRITWAVLTHGKKLMGLEKFDVANISLAKFINTVYTLHLSNIKFGSLGMNLVHVYFCHSNIQYKNIKMTMLGAQSAPSTTYFSALGMIHSFAHQISGVVYLTVGKGS